MEAIKEITNNRLVEIEKYYFRLDVQYEIVKQLKYRECALLMPSWVTNWNSKKKNVRNLRIHSPQYLQQAIKKLNFKNKKNHEYYNMYSSVAIYSNGVPFTTLQLWERDCTKWNKNHFMEMSGYDFFLDIDAGSHDDILFAHKSCMMIIDFLIDVSCPFSVRFSGKGFHIVIPHKYFKINRFDPSKKNSIYKLFYRIAKYFYNNFSEMVDLKIYDSRRVFKLAYSLSHYENVSYVCWPFESMVELDMFKLNDYTLQAKQNRSIRGRGIVVFNKNGNTAELLRKIKEVEDGKKKDA